MVSYTLIRSRRTTIQISVLPDRTSYGSLFAPQQKIDEIVSGKEKWIQKKITARTTAVVFPVRHACVPGETIMYLGKPYILRITDADEKPAEEAGTPVYRDGNHLVVRSRSRAVSSACFETWQADRARTYFRK